MESEHNSDLLKDFLLEAFPNPERKGCPDEQTLKALAEGRLEADHPAALHVGSCSECYSEFRNYRQDWIEAKTAKIDRGPSPAPVVEIPIRSGRRLAHLAIAASLLLACGIGGYEVYRYTQASRSEQVASAVPVYATVDLFEAGTLRGAGDDATPLQAVSLPTAVVHLSITLPRFSQTGVYRIAVSRDRAGRDLAAEGEGTAAELAGKTRVDVTLDLRQAKAGMYFLATVRNSDNGTYYYPLKIN